VVGGLLDAKWVHPHRTARNHLRWLARAADMPKTRVDEVLDLVGLAKAARSPAGDFSLGMSQRLGIAAALLGDPQVLLFDEPVNGLDPQGIAWVRKLMRTMADNGRTVLVSSHLLAEMAQTADELIVIGRGRLIAQCPTAQFISEATEPSVRVRTAQVERLQTALVHKGATVRHEPGALVVVGLGAAEIGELAAAHGVVLHELSPRRGSLEEAYLHHTGDAVEHQSR
jgi:ABC-2 type transport system ATP-binding protein